MTINSRNKRKRGNEHKSSIGQKLEIQKFPVSVTMDSFGDGAKHTGTSLMNVIHAWTWCRGGVKKITFEALLQSAAETCTRGSLVTPAAGAAQQLPRRQVQQSSMKLKQFSRFSLPPTVQMPGLQQPHGGVGPPQSLTKEPSSNVYLEPAGGGFAFGSWQGSKLPSEAQWRGSNPERDEACQAQVKAKPCVWEGRSLIALAKSKNENCLRRKAIIEKAIVLGHPYPSKANEYIYIYIYINSINLSHVKSSEFCIYTYIHKYIQMYIYSFVFLSHYNK